MNGRYAAMNGWRERLARAYGRRFGYRGNKGGWIYAVDENGMTEDRAVAQGWRSFYHKNHAYIWAWVECGQMKGGR